MDVRNLAVTHRRSWAARSFQLLFPTFTVCANPTKALHLPVDKPIGDISPSTESAALDLAGRLG